MNIQERITALVDGELKEIKERKRTTDEIESDENLKFDYNSQLIIKNLLHQRFAGAKAPDYLKQSIKSKIYKEVKSPSVVEKKRFNLFDRLFTPQAAFVSAFAILLLLFIFYPNNNYDPKNFAEEQRGENNMFLQAVNNFDNILSGNLTAQIRTDNAETVASFFQNKGVTYATLIPKCRDWVLAGAVVSEEKGEKFAHHVYTDSKNHLVYIYQADTDYILKSGILNLSSDLMEYLKENPVAENFKNHASALWIKDHKVFVLVSNDSLSKIKRNFLTNLY